MAKRMFNIFNKEFTGLHQAAYLLGVFAIFSQILALVRDRLLAYSFGASRTLDVYYAAFRIPDFIYITIASFISITVLIPFLTEKIDYKNEDGGEKAREFLNTILSVFMLIIIGVSLIAFFLIPKLAIVMVPGFSGNEQDQFILLARILLLSPILLGVSSLFGSITQSYRKFFVYASSSVLYNVGIIIGILFLLPIFGVRGVAFGVVVGALLHLLIQVPTVLRHKLFPRFSFKIDFREVKKVVMLSLPRTLTLSVTNLAFIVLVVVASSMEEGSISVLNLSFNLQSAPLAIIGVSYSVAAFPTLVRFFSKGEHKEFMMYVSVATRHIIFWSIPVIILFIVLRAQIVRTILGAGKFDWSDTRLTAAALAIFSISILAQALQLLFVRAYYATRRTSKPLIINILSAITIITLAFILTHIFRTNDQFRYFIEALLRIEDIQGAIMIMLPLAYSIGMIMNATLLIFTFKHDFKDSNFSLEKTFTEVFGASVIMGFVSHKFLIVFGKIFDINTFMGIFLQGLYAGIIGIVVGVVVLRLLGNKETSEIISILKRKVKLGSRRVLIED